MYLSIRQVSVAFSPITLLLQASLSSQVTVHCGPAKVPLGPSGPDPEDCRTLLAHLPSNPAAQDPDTPLPSSHSLPFLPRGYLHHASCAAQYEYFPRIGRATVVRLSAHPSASLIIEVFAMMKDAGGLVVNRCLETDRWVGGTANGEIRGELGWDIRIEANSADPWWSDQTVYLRTLMTGLTTRMPPLPDLWGFVDMVV